jgi:hypothetical protein
LAGAMDSTHWGAVRFSPTNDPPQASVHNWPAIGYARQWAGEG